VTLELENRAAREALLESIAQARVRVHWQCYIVEDDPIAEGFMHALQQAARRGVEVRLLVDALYSRHDAFGFTNPLLHRLAKTPGFQVRGAQPLSGVPSLADLKQRNHKKLIIIDNELAIISGRNLGAPYFTGFDEVPLKQSSSYRVVPWVDASARLRGPLVGALEQAFARDWRRAGGEAFAVTSPAKAGELCCRLVLHQGLADTYTFEAQLDLVERATTRVLVVNTFPLVVELQRALVRAVKRGVRVQLLFGNVRPRWGAEQAFEGGALRELADDLVRARVEPVVAAGGEAYEVCLPALPTWQPTLEHVYPHVHAKLLVRDEVEVAIGSANVDVTSAYWESEVLLIVEDARFATQTLTHLDALLAQARRVDLASEGWRKEAVRRAWLGRNWPSLVG
jgi:phosphatidylserine/phosphatidylglycerophosphate/cardiolipin synthase-like enzyme